MTFKPQLAVDNVAKLRELSQNLNKLPPRSREFANSLCASYRKYNNLTEKQWPYVHKLLAEIKAADVPKPLPNAHIIPGFKSVEEKLHALREKGQQFPAVRMRYPTKTAEPSLLKIYPSMNGRGCRVKMDGYRIGTIVDEYFKAESNMQTYTEDRVVELLRLLAIDPVLCAKQYAKETKSCCFCGIGLVNRSSVYHGYGPICAGNYGLPWGDVPSEFEGLVEAEEAFEGEKP